MILTDAVSLLAMSALLLSILMRLLPNSERTYKPLLWTQISVFVLLLLSLSWVYPVVDATLGGRNWLNLVSHLIFIGASWIYTTVVAEPFFRDRPTPAPLRAWVPVAAAIGTTTCFLLLEPDFTSRGMEAFTHDPAWIGYWVFNIMTLWVPALVLVPQLREAVKHIQPRCLATAYWALIIGYTSSVLATLGYIATYLDPGLIVLRELLVLVTELGIITALIVIPVSSHQRNAERRTRHQAQAEAAARFQH